MVIRVSVFPPQEFIPYSESGYHVLKASLEGHRGPIYCLAASETLLASGGRDGTKIWDITTFTEVSAVGGSNMIGATTALAWMPRNDSEDGLAYGTGSGYLVLLKKTKDKTGRTAFIQSFVACLGCRTEVTALAYDVESRRLAVATRGEGFYLFKVNDIPKPAVMLAQRLEKHIPKALGFFPVHGGFRDVHTFGLYDGELNTVDTSGQVTYTRKTTSLIGNAVFHEGEGVVCVDDPSEGAAIYSVEGWQKIKVFKVPGYCGKWRPRGVAFHDEAKLVVIGSDHGKVYVFDRKNGKIVDRLGIDDNGWTQTVTTAKIGGTSFVFVAKAELLYKKNAIFVFQKKAERISLNLDETGGWFRMGMQGMMYIAVIIVLWQNLTPLVAPFLNK